MAKNKDKGKKNKPKGGLLYQPNQMLSGIPFGKVAAALTKVETQPAINAQKNLIGSINRQSRRDLAALGAMGDRLDSQAGGMAERLADYGADSVKSAQANQEAIRARLEARSQQSQDQLNQLQGSVLGGQISTLASQMSAPSESQGRLAQIAQMQQSANAANTNAFQDLGATIGAAGVSNAESQRLAALTGAENQRLAIARNIASRQNESRATAGEARREAQSELATLRGLRGATKLKNLLDLRREQQQFQLGRAELAQAGAQARAELGIEKSKLALEREKLEQEGDGGGDGSNRDDMRLGPGEYRQFAAAGKEYLGGGKISNYGDFLDELGQQEGVNWTAVERRKFRKRFKKQNPGLFA